MKSWAPTACAAATICSGGRVGLAEGDVLAHAAGEEEALLRDDPELAAERGLGDVAEVEPVDRDPAVRRVVEAREQLRDRRLARAGVADERDGRARGDVEVDPVQHLVAAAVREPDALEADVSGDLGQVSRARAVDHLGLLVEDLGDLVERGGRREERAVELRELLDGVEEVLHVEHEGEEGADRQRPREVQVAAVAEHDRERDRREQVDEREVEAAVEDGLLVRLAVVVADLAEAARVRALARERLDDPHAGDVLGERRRDEAEALADVAVRPRGVLAEEERADAHRRDHGQRREREPPVEDEEKRPRCRSASACSDEAGDAVGDELVERLDVVRQPADDHARAVRS